MVASLYFSFTQYTCSRTPVWIGIQNYMFMFTKDPNFWLAVRNTIWIIVVGVPLRIVFAILTAWMLTRPKRGVNVYRTLFFMPSLAPPVAAALAFVFILNPATGPINQSWCIWGRTTRRCGSSAPTWSKPGLVILGLWGVGDAMIIFLAGLLDVPRQLYEAADIEGANGWQKFRYVTLPMISPVIFFSLVIGVIYGFQFFTQAYVASIAASGASATPPPPTSGAAAGLDAVLLGLPVPAGIRGLPDGLRVARMAWMLFMITMVCTLSRS